MSLSLETEYDVFLSHSASDKALVRAIAVRLREDGLRVWFDEWEIKIGVSLSAQIEQGLEFSRVLVLCLSANSFNSEWSLLESGTFRFRDPLNEKRRFVLVRLDAAPINENFARSHYIDWLSEDLEGEYAKLLAACQPTTKLRAEERTVLMPNAEIAIQIQRERYVTAYAFSRDGKIALSAVGRDRRGGSKEDDNTLELWSLATSHRKLGLHGHNSAVRSLLLGDDCRYALSASEDRTLRLWDLGSGDCIRILEGHSGAILSIAWTADCRYAVSGGEDRVLKLWDLRNGECLKTLSGHDGAIRSLAWSEYRNHILSASVDGTVRLWHADSGRCLSIFEGHTSQVNCVAWSDDHQLALSGSDDRTIRLWDVDSGRCLRILKGHTSEILSVAWSFDQRYAVSGSPFQTARIWDLDSGLYVGVLKGHPGKILSVRWGENGRVLSGDDTGDIRIWNISHLSNELPAVELSAPLPEVSQSQIQYTNAKVLLVGESGSGKTGLSKVLAGEKWQSSDSTVGAWATQWKLPVGSGEDVEREIWLWDFGGQADQRLIHQLYMDDAALAVLIFDGQKEDVFETLGQWSRDLTRASSKQFSKLLVAGRVDTGGLRVSRGKIEEFAKEHGFFSFRETSSKVGTGCAELKLDIISNISWNNIPWRSSPLVFKRIRDAIIRLKEEGRVLMRFKELREALQLRLPAEYARFADEELRAVLGLLAGPGVVWELKFGSWILFQPERINAYAQAVIQTLSEDEHERGCIAEERVLRGHLTYRSSVARLEGEEERFVLLAMHQMLVERGLCLRENSEHGPLLIFPSYYRRERPELVGHPAVLVSYRFKGFLDEIYATLVVRLHHTSSFCQDILWRYAADFKTLTHKKLGVKLSRMGEGVGELYVYFDPTISLEEKIIFSKYIYEHLVQKATDVIRFRYYVCQHCLTPVESREVAMRRLDGWLSGRVREDVKGRRKSGGRSVPAPPTIVCAECERRVLLWDEMEQCAASSEIQQRVRDLQEEAVIVLDNADKERTLVGEIISTVSLAGQICRELTVGDHGIDMEIEFKSDSGRATGRKVYLQLKSGDSYLRKRKDDGANIFSIDKARHAEYWREQAFPVLLVIRNSKGEILWMEIRDYLRKESDNGEKKITQIVFRGRRFDVMSVRRLRELALAGYTS